MELKPCPNPKCGNPNPTTLTAAKRQVFCHKCHMDGPVGETLEEAEERWNSLPRNPPQAGPKLEPTSKKPDTLCISCNGPVILYRAAWGQWRVQCDACGTTGPQHMTYDGAISAYESLRPKPCQSKHISARALVMVLNSVKALEVLSSQLSELVNAIEKDGA